MFADDNFQDRLQTEEIPNIDGITLNNKVLIEVDCFIYDEIKTKTGIKLFVDNTELISQYVVRHGRVVVVPNRLIDWEEDKSGMTWKTDIELRIDDVVWFYAMTSFDAEKLSFEGRKFILLSYEDIYVAKRKEQVICLNGNVLLEPIFITVEALSFKQQQLDPSRAKVAYIGTPNKEYQQEFRADDPDIKKGMIVLLDGKPFRYIENKMFLFFDGKQYAVVQNHEILGYLNE